MKVIIKGLKVECEEFELDDETSKEERTWTWEELVDAMKTVGKYEAKIEELTNELGINDNNTDRTEREDNPSDTPE